MTIFNGQGTGLPVMLALLVLTLNFELGCQGLRLRKSIKSNMSLADFLFTRLNKYSLAKRNQQKVLSPPPLPRVPALSALPAIPAIPAVPSGPSVPEINPNLLNEIPTIVNKIVDTKVKLIEDSLNAINLNPPTLQQYPTPGAGYDEHAGFGPVIDADPGEFGVSKLVNPPKETTPITTPVHSSKVFLDLHEAFAVEPEGREMKSENFEAIKFVPWSNSLVPGDSFDNNSKVNEDWENVGDQTDAEVNVQTYTNEILPVSSTDLESIPSENFGTEWVVMLTSDTNRTDYEDIYDYSDGNDYSVIDDLNAVAERRFGKDGYSATTNEADEFIEESLDGDIDEEAYAQPQYDIMIKDYNYDYTQGRINNNHGNIYYPDFKTYDEIEMDNKDNELENSDYYNYVDDQAHGESDYEVANIIIEYNEVPANDVDTFDESQTKFYDENSDYYYLNYLDIENNDIAKEEISDIPEVGTNPSINMIYDYEDTDDNNLYPVDFIYDESETEGGVPSTNESSVIVESLNENYTNILEKISNEASPLTVNNIDVTKDFEDTIDHQSYEEEDRKEEVKTKDNILEESAKQNKEDLDSDAKTNSIEETNLTMNANMNTEGSELEKLKDQLINLENMMLRTKEKLRDLYNYQGLHENAPSNKRHVDDQDFYDDTTRLIEQNTSTHLPTKVPQEKEEIISTRNIITTTEMAKEFLGIATVKEAIIDDISMTTIDNETTTEFVTDVNIIEEVSDKVETTTEGNEEKREISVTYPSNLKSMSFVTMNTLPRTENESPGKQQWFDTLSNKEEIFEMPEKLAMTASQEMEEPVGKGEDMFYLPAGHGLLFGFKLNELGKLRRTKLDIFHNSDVNNNLL